ncbi:hypothetical protein SADUNF_Sadunf13G0018200 [Salix dunnii]|uniref:J domain-containing protein n=1 Tax=Salix dunnii TaxID=1413687 RepID=A0A835MUD9_9ROSI|nr:hypothetical protein SADUNF_Sadunf13G0018200 [Salix dunnii]
MESLCFYSSLPQIPPFQKTVTNPTNCHFFPSKTNPLRLFPSLSTSSKFKLHCSGRAEEDSPLSTSSAYTVLGIEPGCSSAAIKAAFRAKVKQFHPDLNKDGKVSDLMIRRIIQAYEMLSNLSRSEIIERECLDPFEEPECEAFDIFVNEVLCVGKGCPYSCVQRAPHAFTYASSTGTARATSQGHGEDYQVQLAVGQCPRSCIHYVTPSQRVILEEFLDSILEVPYDCSAEADLLYSLIVKASEAVSTFILPDLVKQFHPDLNKDGKVSDLMICHIIQAIWRVLKYHLEEVGAAFPHRILENHDMSLKQEALSGDAGGDVQKLELCCLYVLNAAMMCTEENPLRRPPISLVTGELQHAWKEMGFDRLIMARENHMIMTTTVFDDGSEIRGVKAFV